MQASTMPFCITTDSMSDLSPDYLEHHHIRVISLTYSVGEEVYDFFRELPCQQFYGQMREGAPVAAGGFEPSAAEEVFEQLIEKEACDILHISFSGPLSNCYEKVCIAAQAVMRRHPSRRIICFDSRSASLGQGLLLSAAIEQRAIGLDLGATCAHLELLRDHTCHLFAADDVEHLYRGGRISKRHATLNIMLDIRPIVQVDLDGNVVLSNGVRSRRRSLISLLDIMEQRLQYGWAEKNKAIYIAHADAEQDARFLSSRIETRFGFKHFVINPINPTLGVHGGPGLIGVFFLGNHKL